MSVKMQNSSSDILETGKREKREKREWQAESPVVIEDEAFPFCVTPKNGKKREWIWTKPPMKLMQMSCTNPAR